MGEQQPPQQQPQKQDMAYCSGHMMRLPVSQFYPSSLKCHETRCKSCSNDYRNQRRQTDFIEYLRWKLYRSERQRTHRSASQNDTHPMYIPYPTRQFVQRLVDNYQCQGSPLGPLSRDSCIVRCHPQIPIHTCPSNAVVMATSRQARRLPRTLPKRALMLL